jgi:hypothetical protein
VRSHFLVNHFCLLRAAQSPAIDSSSSAAVNKQTAHSEKETCDLALCVLPVIADYSAGAAQQGAGKAALEATGTVVNTNKNKEEVKGNESNTGSKAGVKTNDGETKASEEERIKAIAAKNKKWGDELLNKSQENENKTFHEVSLHGSSCMNCSVDIVGVHSCSAMLIQ